MARSVILVFILLAGGFLFWWNLSRRTRRGAVKTARRGAAPVSLALLITAALVFLALNFTGKII